jgi:hypothetical protein
MKLIKVFTRKLDLETTFWRKLRLSRRTQLRSLGRVNGTFLFFGEKQNGWSLEFLEVFTRK